MSGQMIRKIAFAGVLALGIAFGGLSASRVQAADAPTTAPSEPGKVKKSELHEHMQAIEDAFKKLRRTIKKAEKSADSLALIDTVKKEAAICRELVPSRAAKEADKDKFVADYKKAMDAFIAQVGTLEAAVKAGDTDKAGSIYKEIKTAEDDGHDKFMQQDEKDKAKSDAK